MMRVSSFALVVLLSCGFFKQSVAQEPQICDGFTGPDCAGETDPSWICDPPQFEWTQDNSNNPPFFTGTLDFGKFEKDFGDGNGKLVTRAYGQDCGFSIPGPTIRMAADSTYVLTFQNQLPYQEPSTEENVLKDADITNLHTHGLHISPEWPADDILRLIPGGQATDYVYAIPSEHMGGVHWYHPHHHGSTYVQVAGGALGLIIIDNDDQDNLPPEVDGLQERQLVIQYINTAQAGGSGGDTILSQSSFPNNWLVNGNFYGDNPTKPICAPKGEWERWQILLADTDATAKTVSLGAGCMAYVLAHDGVWRKQPPSQLPDSSITMTAASRAELAVQCNADSELKVGNTVVASIKVYGSEPVSAFPTTTWNQVFRPPYLLDLQGDEISVTEKTISMGARTINGEKFDKDNSLFVTDLTEPLVYEYTLKGASAHPLHQHIHHFQIQSCGGSSHFDDGEFYDTISSNCKLRFNLEYGFSGKMIMHCHVLDHEDEGAMTWVNVTIGEGRPSFPANGGPFIDDEKNPTQPINQNAICSSTPPSTPAPSTPPPSTPTPGTPDPTGSPTTACSVYKKKRDCENAGCTWSGGTCVA